MSSMGYPNPTFSGDHVVIAAKLVVVSWRAARLWTTVRWRFISDKLTDRAADARRWQTAIRGLPLSGELMAILLSAFDLTFRIV